MSRAFLPFSVGVGLIAGQLARKIFERIWGRVEEGEPPKPKHRDFGSWAKLIAALCVEGAVFRLVRGIADHYARRAFAAVTGSWPGEEKRNRKR